MLQHLHRRRTHPTSPSSHGQGMSPHSAMAAATADSDSSCDTRDHHAPPLSLGVTVSVTGCRSGPLSPRGVTARFARRRRGATLPQLALDWCAVRLCQPHCGHRNKVLPRARWCSSCGVRLSRKRLHCGQPPSPGKLPQSPHTGSADFPHLWQLIVTLSFVRLLARSIVWICMIR